MSMSASKKTFKVNLEDVLNRNPISRAASPNSNRMNEVGPYEINRASSAAYPNALREGKVLPEDSPEAIMKNREDM